MQGREVPDTEAQSLCGAIGVDRELLDLPLLLVPNSSLQFRAGTFHCFSAFS